MKGPSTSAQVWCSDSSSSTLYVAHSVALTFIPAGAMMFSRVQSGGGTDGGNGSQGPQGSSEVSSLTSASSPLSRVDALAASADAYERAAAIGLPGISGMSSCDLAVRAVEARLASLLLLGDDRALPGRVQGEDEDATSHGGRDIVTGGASGADRLRWVTKRVLEGLNQEGRPECRVEKKQALNALKLRFDEWRASNSAKIKTP